MYDKIPEEPVTPFDEQRIKAAADKRSRKAAKNAADESNLKTMRASFGNINL